MNSTCESCQYFRETRSRGIDINPNRRGECRRYPPVQFLLTTGSLAGAPQAVFDTRYPSMPPNWPSCGEYEENFPPS